MEYLAFVALVVLVALSSEVHGQQNPAIDGIGGAELTGTDESFTTDEPAEWTSDAVTTPSETDSPVSKTTIIPTTSAAATTSKTAKSTTPAPKSPSTASASSTSAGPKTTTSHPRPVEKYCENDQWLYNNGKCYWSSVLNGVASEGYNWYHALVKCASMRSNVISIHDDAENGVAYPLTCAKSVWLGLVASGSVVDPKNWAWTDLSSSNYSNWAEKTECDKYVNGSCVEWLQYPQDKFGCSYENTDKGFWYNSADCARAHKPFVCEKPALPKPIELPAIVRNNQLKVQDSSCRPGWKFYAGSCYWVSQEKVDYFEAEITCREKDSQIASIHEQGTSGFLLVNVGRSCDDLWIGLVNVNPTSMSDKASWEWDDMSPVDFINWPTGTVPDNDQTKLCSTISHAGFWYNQHCWSLNRFVCKMGAL